MKSISVSHLQEAILKLPNFETYYDETVKIPCLEHPAIIEGNKIPKAPTYKDSLPIVVFKKDYDKREWTLIDII